MKIYLLLLLLLSNTSFAIFYGKQNMMPIEGASPEIKEFQKSIALKIRKRKLKLVKVDNQEYYKVKYTELGEINLSEDTEKQQFLCNDQSFAKM